MEPRIKGRFNERILAEAARRFGVTVAQLKELDGFESFIYEYERDGAGFILRMGHSAGRTMPLIRGEVAWTNYLADGGAAVFAALAAGLEAV